MRSTAAARTCGRLPSPSRPPACCAWPSASSRRLVAGRVSLGVEYDLRNRMYQHLHSLELGFFDSQQTGQLMSRATVDLQAVRFFLGLRADLHPAVSRDDRDRGGGDVLGGPDARRGVAGPDALRHLGRVSLRATQPAGVAGGPAADRRADRRSRGEHRWGARGQGLRSGGPAAAPLPAHGAPGVRPVDGLHPPTRLLLALHRLPASARAGRRALRGRQAGDRRSAQRGRFRGLLRLRAHAHLPHAHARHRAGHGPARRGERRSACSSCSTASRGSCPRPTRRPCRRAGAAWSCATWPSDTRTGVSCSPTST